MRTNILAMAAASSHLIAPASSSPTWQPWQPCPTISPEILTSYTTTNQTRSFVKNMFSAVALDNFGASFAAVLSDDLTWTVTGSSLIAGTYHPKSVYISQVLNPLRAVLDSLPVPIVEHIVVEGCWATVVWHSDGVYGKNGADYDMKYAWIMRAQPEGTDGELKIVEVIGFYDGQKVTNVFEGYDLAVLRNGTV